MTLNLTCSTSMAGSLKPPSRISRSFTTMTVSPTPLIRLQLILNAMSWSVFCTICQTKALFRLGFNICHRRCDHIHTWHYHVSCFWHLRKRGKRDFYCVGKKMLLGELLLELTLNALQLWNKVLVWDDEASVFGGLTLTMCCFQPPLKKALNSYSKNTTHLWSSETNCRPMTGQRETEEQSPTSSKALPVTAYSQEIPKYQRKYQSKTHNSIFFSVNPLLTLIMFMWALVWGAGKEGRKTSQPITRPLMTESFLIGCAGLLQIRSQEEKQKSSCADTVPTRGSCCKLPLHSQKAFRLEMPTSATMSRHAPDSYHKSI